MQDTAPGYYCYDDRKYCVQDTAPGYECYDDRKCISDSIFDITTASTSRGPNELSYLCLRVTYLSL